MATSFVQYFAIYSQQCLFAQKHKKLPEHTHNVCQIRYKPSKMVKDDSKIAKSGHTAVLSCPLTEQSWSLKQILVVEAAT